MQTSANMSTTTTSSSSNSSSSSGSSTKSTNSSNHTKTSTASTSISAASSAASHVSQGNPSSALAFVPPTNSTSTNFYQFLCIVGACIICYYNSAQCGLVFDDISAIRDNKDLRPSTPLTNIFRNDFWGTPMRKEQSHKSYRPLTVLTFRFNYWLHGVEPYGFHVVNVLLHIAVCLLWRRVCRLLLQQCAGVGRRTNNAEMPPPPYQCDCSFLATLLFAVHPIHTEAVTGVVGRAELLSALFFLAAFLSYASAVMPQPAASSRRAPQLYAATRWLPLVVNFSICLLASMLSKEQGITIAGICVAYEIFVVQQLRPLDLWSGCLRHIFEDGHKKPGSPLNSGLAKTSTKTSYINLLKRHSVLLKRICFLVLITMALIVGRVYVMGSQLPVFTRFDNPASAAETPQRQLTFSYLIFLNCWLLLFPCDLCCDWTMGTIPLIEGFADPRNLLTLATFLVLLALVLYACFSQNVAQSRVIIMCLAWLVLPFLPASNLFFPVGFVVAERILYAPSMGFCLLIAVGYANLQQYFESRGASFSKFLTNSLIGLLLLSHVLKTHQRNKDWTSEYTLFMSGIQINSRNAKLFNNVGHALENAERYAEALEYFKQAVNIQADDIGAHINVGRTYNNLKMFREAEEAYLKAKALFPKIKPGESYQARIAPSHLNVFINLANLISKNSTRLEEADHLYKQAISMRADYVQAYINRGDILMKLNRTAQAQEVYEKALLYDSENADIYYNLGVVFLEQGKSAQANVYFNKAIELYPEHEQALLNSAILLQELGGDDARRLSKERLYKVLRKDDNNEKVYFNLGMLAMDESNFDEAEQFFKRAIHLKENFRSALFNLALLLADANRPLDAVPYLHQLIRFYPDHVKGLILLGDIYINHMQDLDAAEHNYREILKYDPHNVQGLHNLCVVFVERKRLARAHDCLEYAHRLAPTEDYILRHLQIVKTRLDKIAKLPDSSAEKQSAFADYDPAEFKVGQS